MTPADHGAAAVRNELEIERHERNLTKLPDQTFALRDGHYCIVAGRIFGPWPDVGAATAGMQTEQRRAVNRAAKAAK